ncbi:MAG: DUF5667 domain-containing protein [Micromonosporaceae bacterium]
MIPSPFGHRRADRFAQLLDEAEGARRRHTRTPYDEELAPLVAVAHASAEQMSTLAEQVTVDPAYRRRLRQRLLAVAHTQGIGDTAEIAHEPEPTVAPRRRVKLAVAVGATAGVLALSGVSTASGDAIPGDTLYPVKRQTERAQLALAGSDVNRGQLYLGFARTRLSEARAIVDNPEALDAALDDMDSDTRNGVRLLTGAAVDRRDPEVLGTVDSFVSGQRRKVIDLVTRLDGTSRTRALSSLELLDSASDRVAALRPALLCTGESDRRTDTLGPLPQRCSALPDPGRPGAGATGGDKASRDTRTSDRPTESADPSKSSPDGLLPIDPTDPLPDEPSESPQRSPSSSILDELGRIIDNLLG